MMILHSKSFFFYVVRQLIISQSICHCFSLFLFLSADGVMGQQLKLEHVGARSVVLKTELNFQWIKMEGSTDREQFAVVAKEF